jgi:hypothetical protein
LAAKGNPTILHSLVTPAEARETEWSAILAHREIFLARTHARKYFGYTEAWMFVIEGTLVARSCARGTLLHGSESEKCAQVY